MEGIKAEGGRQDAAHSNLFVLIRDDELPRLVSRPSGDCTYIFHVFLQLFFFSCVMMERVRKQSEVI